MCFNRQFHLVFVKMALEVVLSAFVPIKQFFQYFELQPHQQMNPIIILGWEEEVITKYFTPTLSLCSQKTFNLSFNQWKYCLLLCALKQKIKTLDYSSADK